MIKSFFNKTGYLRKYHNLTGGQVIYQKLLEHNVDDVFIYRWCCNAIN